MMDKPTLRAHYREQRKAIAEAQRIERSAGIEKLVLSIERIQHAGSVFVYVSAGSEVRTHELIAALLGQGKVVAVPRVISDAGEGVMEAVVVRGLDDFAPGRFGIPEPTTRTVFGETPDVAIVPGIAFTRGGLRLGQGGGYYDRYLVQHPSVYKVGLCFEEQLADALPVDAHDVRMDEVVVG